MGEEVGEGLHEEVGEGPLKEGRRNLVTATHKLGAISKA